MTSVPCTNPLEAIHGAPQLSRLMVTCSRGLTVTWKSAQTLMLLEVLMTRVFLQSLLRGKVGVLLV